MKKTVKKMVERGVIAAVLVYGTPNSASASGSAEVMAGYRSTTLDVKSDTELSSRSNVFVRNTTTISYKNSVENVGLVDVSYNIRGSLDAVIETQFITGVGVIPRTGVQYFTERGDVSFYVLATGGFNGTEGDAEVLTNIAYAPTISAKGKGMISLENVTNVGSAGHNFSTQVVRVGVSNGKYETGFGLNLAETKEEISPNAGGYLKVNF